MKREIVVEIILALVVILLIVAIREIRSIKSEIEQTQARQPFPSVELTLIQTPTPHITSLAPTSYPVVTQFSQQPAGCTSNKDCGGSWCTNSEPPSCYEEKCINFVCTSIQTGWHGTPQLKLYQ